MDGDLLNIGELVLTPSGAVAVVRKHIYGARGDLFRYLVHYVGSAEDDCVRLIPEHLKTLGIIVDERRCTYTERRKIHPRICT